ncbi:Calponin [Pyrenophora tritici-repentis]|nr:Calponin [Pyrenophora tritici-repentis]
MASVTSLDQDMKKLRMDRYTPKAANEVRSWIEDVLGERLPPGDLLDALKDGTVLCRYGTLSRTTKWLVKC